MNYTKTAARAMTSVRSRHTDTGVAAHCDYIGLFEYEDRNATLALNARAATPSAHRTALIAIASAALKAGAAPAYDAFPSNVTSGFAPDAHASETKSRTPTRIGELGYPIPRRSGLQQSQS